MQKNSKYLIGSLAVLAILLLPLATQARWISVDPKANQLPSMSPYTYCRNNPITNIDPDGQLDIPANQQKQYPKLTAYVKNNIKDVVNVPRISNALQKNGEFTSQSLKSALTWGQGPTLNVTPLSNAYGEFTPGVGSSELRIDQSLVQQLESAQAGKADAVLLLLGVTILHELTHYGDDQDGQDRPGEEGTQFEIDAYGQGINTTTDAQTVINNQQKQQQQQQKKPQTP